MQAKRAFVMSLKCDPANDNTLRELVQLQVHVRDYPGFEETARKILMSKPTAMTNWVTLAAACYANRNYTGCLQAVDSILGFTQQEDGKSRMKPCE